MQSKILKGLKPTSMFNPNKIFFENSKARESEIELSFVNGDGVSQSDWPVPNWSDTESENESDRSVDKRKSLIANNGSPRSPGDLKDQEPSDPENSSIAKILRPGDRPRSTPRNQSFTDSTDDGINNLISNTNSVSEGSRLSNDLYCGFSFACAVQLYATAH